MIGPAAVAPAVAPAARFKATRPPGPQHYHTSPACWGRVRHNRSTASVPASSAIATASPRPRAYRPGDAVPRSLPVDLRTAARPAIFGRLLLLEGQRRRVGRRRGDDPSRSCSAASASQAAVAAPDWAVAAIDCARPSPWLPRPSPSRQAELVATAGLGVARGLRGDLGCPHRRDLRVSRGLFHPPGFHRHGRGLRRPDGQRRLGIKRRLARQGRGPPAAVRRPTGQHQRDRDRRTTRRWFA